MDEIHYLISDASKKIDVEAHVLRYWEDELELEIPRNEMGHRYYTESHIRLFREVKSLKEKGYQLKAIKNVLLQMREQNRLSGEIMEQDMNAALMQLRENTPQTGELQENEADTLAAMEEKMEQFQQIMNRIIGRALEVNNEKLSQDVSSLVHEKLEKELEYQLELAEKREEERFRKLDELLRSFQKESQDEAAATKIPFFKKKRFGRSGKKLI